MTMMSTSAAAMLYDYVHHHGMHFGTRRQHQLVVSVPWEVLELWSAYCRCLLHLLPLVVQNR